MSEEQPSNRRNQGNSAGMPGWALVMREQLSTLTRQVKEVQDGVDESNRTLHTELLEEIKSLREEQNLKMKEVAENYITWSYIVDKLAIPVALTVLGFAISVVCPGVIVLITLLPQIFGLLGLKK